MQRMLFVDNDPLFLSRLRRSLQRYADQWIVDIATTGSEALAKLSVAEADVVVAELRMPEMDGSQLLAQVRQCCPRALRIIQRDFNAEESVFRTLGPAHQALEKPYDVAALHAAVKRAMQLRSRLDDPALQILTGRITQLPTLPAIYNELIDELNLIDTSCERVGKIISRDVGMTAKMLQLVNSSFFGLGQRVTDPPHAAALLGMSLVRSLVLTVGVFSQFEQQVLPGFSLQRMVEHSIDVGRIAQRLARAMGCSKVIQEDALLAGVLHDVGKTVLATGIPDRYTRVITEAQTGSDPAWRIEKACLGVTHGDIGGYLLALWGFPPAVIEAVTFHHEPTEVGETGFDALAAVHLADTFVHLRQDSSDRKALTLKRDYIEHLDLGEFKQDCEKETLGPRELRQLQNALEMRLAV